MADIDYDFDKLYELVSSNYKNEKEKCLVCHVFMETKEIELSCTHKYHFTCFDIKKNNKCFYCGKINKNKETVHKNKEKNINILNNSNCKSLIKTGPKKGEICGRINCKYHIK